MTSRTLCRADFLLAHAGAAGAVLGLDTGSPIASLALVVAGRLAGGIARPVTSHGAALPQAVAQLLDRAELRASDLSGIAVGIGPGSFTGLRIGLSYAKGLAFASEAKIIGVASLDALAAGALDTPAARPGLQVCALLDARKGEVYAALYEIVADGLEKISQDVVMPLVRVTSPLRQNAILAGDYTAKDAAALAKKQGLEVTVLGPEALELRGRYIAALGAARIAAGQSDSIDSLEPLYIRPPDAIAASGQSKVSEGVWSAERKNLSSSI
jgi:tRNA threonylcarbamoyladenosine biosynthesis protein TsaB